MDAITAKSSLIVGKKKASAVVASAAQALDYGPVSQDREVTLPSEINGVGPVWPVV